MAEIYAYQSTMDDVRCKGQGQIGRYFSSHPGIKSVIEKQLGNVQSSYNALLNTALQIKVCQSLVEVSSAGFISIFCWFFSNGSMSRSSSSKNTRPSSRAFCTISKNGNRILPSNWTLPSCQLKIARNNWMISRYLS